MIPRILVCDDYPDIAEMLSLTLRSAGFEVEAAHGGLEALARYEMAWDESRPYNLLILDLAMPELTGVEVAERIRAGGDISTAIAFLTAYVDPMTPARARVLNISGIWQKPLDGRELCRLVRRLLCPAGPSAGAAHESAL